MVGKGAVTLSLLVLGPAAPPRCVFVRPHAMLFCRVLCARPSLQPDCRDMALPISNRPRQADKLLRKRSSHGLCLSRLVRLSFSLSLRYFPSVIFSVFSPQASSFRCA